MELKWKFRGQVDSDSRSTLVRLSTQTPASTVLTSLRKVKAMDANRNEKYKASLGPVRRYILSYHTFTFAYMAPFKARSLYFPTKAQHV